MIKLSLCLKWTREVRKNGRSKISPFLYSNGHTEAKKYLKNFSTDTTFYVIKNMLEFF